MAARSRVLDGLAVPFGLHEVGRGLAAVDWSRERSERFYSYS